MLICAARAQQRRPAVAELGQPARRLHARVRRGGLAEQRGERRRPAELLAVSDIPPQGRPVPLDRPEVYFGENLDGYSLVGAQAARVQLPEEGREQRLHPVQGRRRRRALALAAPRRVRAALQRLEPADLGPDHAQDQDPVPARHHRAGEEGGAVPALRRGPVPGHHRRPARLGVRRLHDERQLPVLAVASTARAARRARASTTSATR